MKRPALAVEQEDSGLCQPAVTHIPRRGTLSYLSPDVHRTIHVRVHRRLVRLTDVQTTLHMVAISNLPATRTHLRGVLLVYTINEDTVFLGLVFKQAGESVELPAVQLLVPRRTPAPRVTVLILADVTKIANRYLLHALFDTPLNDVFAEGVEEVVFASREFLPSLPRSLRRAILTFSLVLLTSEVVFVLFQRVPRIQLTRAVFVVDGEIVADSEVDTRCLVTGGVLDGNLFLTDEMEFPVVVVVDGTHLLDVLNFYVRVGFVLGEDEVRPTLFQVETALLKSSESYMFAV